MRGQRYRGATADYGNWRIDHQHLPIVGSGHGRLREERGSGRVFGTDVFGGQISISVSPAKNIMMEQR